MKNLKPYANRFGDLILALIAMAINIINALPYFELMAFLCFKKVFAPSWFNSLIISAIIGFQWKRNLWQKWFPENKEA